MLNPIDTATVIGSDRFTGVYPAEIHEGVAWWAAACFVVVARCPSIAVGDDGHPTTAEFRRRFCRGAINARHYACQVADLGTAEEIQLHYAMAKLKNTAGALLSTADAGGRQRVTIRMFHAGGQAVTDDNGLADIRDLITRDRVPLPVNVQAKGTVTDRRDLVRSS